MDPILAKHGASRKPGAVQCGRWLRTAHEVARCKGESSLFLPATFHCLTSFWVQTEARLADLGYRQLPTDLAGEHVGNLRVSGYGFNGARGGIRPQRMSTALSFQEAAVSA